MKAKKYLILPILTLCFCGNFPSVYSAFAYGKTPKNSYVFGVEIGNMQREKAVEKVEKYVKENAPKLSVFYGNYYENLSEYLTFTTDAFSVVKHAKSGKDLPINIEWKVQNLEKITEEICSVVRVKSCDAECFFSPSGFEYFEEKSGVEPKKNELEILLENTVKNLRLNDEKSIEIPVEIIRPKLSLSTLKTRTKPIASFSTSFSTADKNRTENIRRACAFLDGQKILPNEIFSFNRAVGERTKNRGFANAKIIRSGEFVLGVGGGVCQVSTTLYNAVLLARLKVTERNPHSLSVSYVPPSRDAMVSDYSDLKFLNTSPYPVYLSAKTDDNRVIMTLYGKPDGFTYKIVSEKVETIPQGKEKVVFGEEEKILRYGKDGLKSQAYLEKYKGKNLLSRQKLSTDTYLPTQTVKQSPEISR